MSPKSQGHSSRQERFPLGVLHEKAFTLGRLPALSHGSVIAASLFNKVHRNPSNCMKPEKEPGEFKITDKTQFITTDLKCYLSVKLLIKMQKYVFYIKWSHTNVVL